MKMKDITGMYEFMSLHDKFDSSHTHLPPSLVYHNKMFK